MNNNPEPSGQHDAHVQVLTAEVRTLMVGSRQVTLSVYNQLDEVAAAQIEPFGRTRPRAAQLDYLYLVGRHRQTGALVRAVVPGGPVSIAREHGWATFSDSIEELREVAKGLGREIARLKKFEDDCHQKLPDNHHCVIDEIRTKEQEVRVAESALASRQREYNEIAAPAIAWAAEFAGLPLIVLAGLR